jgi:hypothetical protein
MTRQAKRRLVVVAVALATGGCMAPRIAPTIPGPPTPEQMAQFWVEPTDLARRDLYWGPWGEEHAPKADGRWDFVKRDSKGFSKGYDVKDERGMVWSVKIGEEAQSETVSSRLMSALGYHQPPVYYVKSWTLTGGGNWAGPQEPARFRPELPGLKDVAEWSWHSNPFVGTQPWRGALVMMVLLANSDLKPNQNVLYDLDRQREGASRWYVVKDLGQSLGETGVLFPDRNNIEEWEKEPFIRGVSEGKVRFNYSGRWKELFRDLTPADVRWTCERLNRLSDQQWRDVFRGAGYEPALADRFIRRFRQKIEEGMRLGG